MKRRGPQIAFVALTLVFAVLGIAACGGGGSKKQEPTKPAELSTQDKVRMAQSMLTAGRTGDAVELLDQALAEEPDSAQLQLFYGKITFQAGKFSDALEAFKRAIELDPYLTDAHNFLGATYAELGMNAEAEQEYLTALADPAYTSDCCTPRKGGPSRRSKICATPSRSTRVSTRHTSSWPHCSTATGISSRRRASTRWPSRAFAPSANTTTAWGSSIFASERRARRGTPSNGRSTSPREATAPLRRASCSS